MSRLTPFFLLLGAMALMPLPSAAKTPPRTDKPVAARPDLSGNDPHWAREVGGCWGYVYTPGPTDPQFTWSGGCKDRLLDGQGKMTFLASGMVETGEFHAGKLNGPGRTEYPGDNYAEGNFIDGYLDGEAKLLSWRTGTHFEGATRHGDPQGFGTLTYGNGDKYTGTFLEGKFDGQGTMTFVMNGSYTGGFLLGHFQGHGVRSYPNGASIEAEYYGGVPGNDAIYHLPDGTVLKGRIVSPRPDPANPMTDPEYPKLAIRLGHEGEIRLALTVGLDGKVKYARIADSSGHDDLDQAALQASANWQLLPGSVGGTPAELECFKKVVFKLSD